MKVLVFGAGVVGQVYAGRLAEAGHDVTVLARNRRLQDLKAQGVHLQRGSEHIRASPHVTAEVAPGEGYDVVLVTVRRDQLADALPVVAGLTAERVVLMMPPGDPNDVARVTGEHRTVFAFPGIGGFRTADGTVHYVQVPQQKTTVGRRDGLERVMVDLMRSAQFPVDVCADMAGWLATHAVFVTGVGAALLACHGDSAALAADRPRVATMVRAVGEGFRSLASKDVAVLPRGLRVIFTIVPPVVSVPYWQRQLRGPVGVIALAPHVRASQHTELPALCADVRALLAGGRPHDTLERLLATVG